ncbi:hypothetical protein Sbal625DRAFT_4147 [Shewanella baltica OS625]|uniref:hypothetical protein n=1 Tax=Shewanella baltica TaxID=62322 RepID=UPI000230DF01|nr:hypothetical protein [Shewanella baltica]EHC04187.1 hypothetical protein Sbal625DRAFT_4147 [Shewanella baltica OS625]
MAIELVTFPQMKAFLVAHYKGDRLYGRTPARGWPQDYADLVVSSHMVDLNDRGYGFISMHESANGKAMRYTVEDVINQKLETNKLDRLLLKHG